MRRYAAMRTGSTRSCTSSDRSAEVSKPLRCCAGSYPPNRAAAPPRNDRHSSIPGTATPGGADGSSTLAPLRQAVVIEGAHRFAGVMPLVRLAESFRECEVSARKTAEAFTHQELVASLRC